ncbi:MAG: saccharopine dehydrogenase C-terminal domain-containing protein [Bacteroidia bacterium]
MTKILIIGAGRSTSSLIDYLLKRAGQNNWQVTVSDVSLELAQSKTKGFENATAVSFDVADAAARESIISAHDMIISMLPAFMHADVARDCVRFGKHMATASYVSADMKELNADAGKKGLLLLNECGLDPGIDHASAMKIIDEVHAQGGEISSFKSFCGGLVAPESNDNPWGYKFSWNPRNVVLAGQGTAQYYEDGHLKFIPYSRLFTQTDSVEVKGHGTYDAYANRDSISYKEPYGLKNIKTLLRGTLRETGYCKAWNVFVKLGLTDDTYKIKNASSLTYSALLNAYLPTGLQSTRDKLKQFMGNEADQAVFEKLDYLEIFGDKKIKRDEGTPAQLLQDLLEEKWVLKPGDKDLIVMQHQFEYVLPGALHKEQENNAVAKKLNSSLVVTGDDEVHTAMAKTVGLPLAITVKNFLTGKFRLSGVQIPTVKVIYEPLLTELEEHGIRFTEEEV